MLLGVSSLPPPSLTYMCSREGPELKRLVAEVVLIADHEQPV